MLRRWVLLGVITCILSLWGLQLCQLLAPVAETATWRAAVWHASFQAARGLPASRDADVLQPLGSYGLNGYRSLETFSPWLPLIKVWFPVDLFRYTREIVTGSWPDRNGPVEQTAGWWGCVWLMGLGFLAFIAADPRGRERVSRPLAPRWSSVGLLALAAAAFWLLIVPTCFILREFVHEVWLSVAENHITAAGFVWTRPSLSAASATLTCLMLAAIALVALARAVVWPRRRRPGAEPTADIGLCRTCAYAVGELPRCPECGDADPRGPGPYFLTRFGAWIHARAWRRWGLRSLVVAWISIGMLLPAIAGSAQMLGARAGWW